MSSIALPDIDRLTGHVARAIDSASEGFEPFHHLRFVDFFPADVYAAMLEAMPAAPEYGLMSGRARLARARDGGHARTKVDLFPEGLMHLAPGKRSVWDAVGRTLRSNDVREAWTRRLAPGLEKRFGARHSEVKMYPVPLLTRDLPGYRIGVHADTPRKGMTIQIYLPGDHTIKHVGTVFNRREGDGYREAARMSFSPNSGYAFAVTPDSYHSVDIVGAEVRTRDSILLNYFVDETLPQVVRNRCKRLGNLARTLGWRRAQ